MKHLSAPRKKAPRNASHKAEAPVDGRQLSFGLLSRETLSPAPKGSATKASVPETALIVMGALPEVTEVAPVPYTGMATVNPGRSAADPIPCLVVVQDGAGYSIGHWTAR